jgi:RimJ/RimL family protein N-acetyltransferase
MSFNSKPQVDWQLPGSLLTAKAPSVSQITEQALALATFFNEPHNRHMMGNTVTMTAKDVIDHYSELEASGGMPFLLFVDGVLVGDADFRHPTHGLVEFAIVLGPRHTQGKGLGTRFAIMLHAWAFLHFGMERIIVTILPHNQASLCLFEKLGHQPDHSPAARAFADEPTDLVLSISRESFTHHHAAVLPDIRFFL